ncbi:MAG: tetratricopeptide repeat protein [Vicingaceae bacterium]
MLFATEQRDKNISLSISLGEEAKLISEENFYTKGLAESLIQLGKTYQNYSNYGEAMKAALQAMELFRGLNDYSGESVCLDILGGVYNFLGDYNKRLDCNLKCLALREKANDIPTQLSTTNNIGDTYMEMGDYKNALKYFEHCLTFSNLSNQIRAIVYYNIGEVYFNLKEYNAAQEQIKKGLIFGKSSGYWQIQIAAQLLNAKILIKQNKNKEAINNLDKAKLIVIEKNNLEEEYTLYRVYSEAYENLKQYDKAYAELKKYNLLKEELLNDNSAQKLKKIEFEFQFKGIRNEAEETKKKNKLLTKAFNQIEAQRNEIAFKNLSITDSIKYAKRIQNSILPTTDKIINVLPNSFVFYQPKDIVSGDFYWINKIGNEVIFSVIDCTGHGVPGAFVSLIAYNALNKIVVEQEITKPANILNAIDQIMIESFSNTENAVRDGMDMGVCSWNTKTNQLQFSGAYHSLFICNNSQLKEVKGNRESIGYSFFEKKAPFTNHQVNIEEESVVYLSSDGFPDQFGGEKGKKLKWNGFRGLLKEVNNKKFSKQKEELSQFLNNWKGDLEQLDDICVMGVKLLKA